MVICLKSWDIKSQLFFIYPGIIIKLPRYLKKDKVQITHFQVKTIILALKLNIQLCVIIC